MQMREGLTTQGLVDIAWAYARQAQLAAEYDKESSSAITIYTDIGEDLLMRLFSRIADSFVRDFKGSSTTTEQSVSDTAWAFAVLGLKHGTLLEAAFSPKTRRSKPNNAYEKNRPRREQGPSRRGISARTLR